MSEGDDTGLVLAVLKQRADEHGMVTGLSFPMIAKLSGVGLRSVPRHLERLEARGLIASNHERGRGRRNAYQILPAI